MPVEAIPDAVDDDDVWPCGTHIGPWRIERLLGVGGMGNVYAVVHDEIGKKAALKVMHGSLASGLNAERVALEGQVVNRVGHPNIVDIFGAGVIGGLPYLVMERLDGTTLATFAGGRRLDPRVAVEILRQVCSALTAAHAAGIIHRDLKPDNIIVGAAAVDGTFRVKLLDWGIAKVLGDSERRTMKGQVIGTPDYLAPEQALGQAVSSKTDVYALGVIAYRLFLGTLPFQAATVAELLWMHCHHPPTAPVEVWPEIPTRLQQLLLAMLAKVPQQRPRLETVHEELCLVEAQLPERTRAVDNTVGEPQQSSQAAAAFAPTRLLAHAPPEPGFSVASVVIVAAVLGLLALAAQRETRAPSSVHTSTASAAAPAPMPVATPALAPRSMPSTAPLTTSPPTIAPVDVAQAPPATAISSVGAIAPVPTEAGKRVGKRRQPVHAGDRALARSALPPVRQAAVADAPDSRALVQQYVAVGRELKGCEESLDVTDLRARYRWIRIYEAMRTAEARQQAAGLLTALEHDLERCRSVATR